MKVEVRDNDVILKEIEDFCVAQTLECGQCFHFEKIAENEYVLVHNDKMLHIFQNGEEVIFYNTTLEDFENVWQLYFDLDRDYGNIKNAIIEKDEKLKDAVEEMWGIRILNQDFFEMLISFIISQNKQIPHIKKIVFELSEKYGKPLGDINGKVYYSFPDIKALSRVSLEELKECKTGFRAPYIMDAIKNVETGIISEKEIRNLTEEEAMLNLTKIKGVGEKVASCVMLFSLGFRASFPVDVWIKRIMEDMYFEEEQKKEVISAFGKERFGEYGGYAQQYLFYYGRKNKIGK